MFSSKAIKAIHESIKMGEPVRGPFDIQILPLNVCNQACVFCPLHSIPEAVMKKHAPRFLESAKRMEWRLFERIVEGLEELGEIERVHFTGGEPLLHTRIVDMVKLLKDRFENVVVGVVTNGVPLIKRFDELAQAGVDRISISINTADEETYMRLSPSNTPKDFQNIIEGLDRAGTYKQKLKEKGQYTDLELALTCVLTRYNYNHAGALVEIAARFGIDSITFIPLVPFEYEGVSSNADFAVSREQFEEFLLDISKFAPEANEKGIWLGYSGNNDDGGLLKLLQNEQNRPCYAGYSFTVFWPDGSVRPCCNCETVMGDVSRQSLTEIWRSDIYKEFRSKAISGEISYDSRCSCAECGYLFENRTIEAG